MPRDVLITGFDDSQLAAACGPGITSVHQDVARMAQLAIELLMQMLRGDQPRQHYYQLPVYLTRRCSTCR